MNEINLKEPEKIGWEEKPQNKATFGSSLYSRIDRMSKPLFWSLFVIFLVVFVGVGFYFYSYLSNRNIAFTASVPQDVLSGVPFNLEVAAKNNFNNEINDVKISVVLPDGTFLGSEDKEKRFYEKDFGTLAKDANFQEGISIIAFSGGEAQTIKKFSVKISYYTPAIGSGSRFEQTKIVEVSIGEPGLRLDVVTPQKVLNNEEFEVEIHFRNISDINFSSAKLELTYPDEFVLKSATIAPSQKNNIWLIGDLPKSGPEGSVLIKGKLVSSQKSFFDFKGVLSAQVAGHEYAITEKIAQVSITPSPLVLNINVNEKQSYIVSAGENLKYTIDYYNSSDVGLNDAVIVAKLDGAMFDLATYSGNGFLDSKNNTITWNVANTSNLRVVNPASGGSVSFLIRAKGIYPIKKESDKNFVLAVSVEMSSPTVPYSVSSDKTISFANIKNNVSGDIGFLASALFYDSSPGINNKGPFPPKVNQATDFTVHWKITNYSTDVSSVKINSFLQSGVRWTGQVKSNINSVPEYNERTQEVVWNIDKILATKGVISAPVEAIFQVEVTPNIAQFGQIMQVIGQTNIQAFDDFNKINLTDSVNPLTIGTNVAQ